MEAPADVNVIMRHSCFRSSVSSEGRRKQVKKSYLFQEMARTSYNLLHKRELTNHLELRDPFFLHTVIVGQPEEHFIKKTQFFMKLRSIFCNHIELENQLIFSQELKYVRSVGH